MTRRKFVKVAGAAIALSGTSLAAHILEAAEPAAAAFGGPTPNGKFYITSYGSTPSVDANRWRLKIHGLVKNPFTLNYRDITAMPQVRETLTLECISNPPDGDAISNAEWVGTKVKPILERAQVDRRAVYAAMRGADGYRTGVPVEELMREENFMPYLMNGVALPAEHGFPVRIFIPGKYGMKQPKWLTEIEFIDHEFIGYWEARGWSQSAWRKVNSGFFYPRAPRGLLSGLISESVTVKAPIEIVGWALAGTSGIKRVEVSTDDGESWHDARLAENRSRYVWTVWSYRFAPAKPGDYLVRVRATDGAGKFQPPSDEQRGNGRSGQPKLKLDVTAV